MTASDSDLVLCVGPSRDRAGIARVVGDLNLSLAWADNAGAAMSMAQERRCLAVLQEFFGDGLGLRTARAIHGQYPQTAIIGLVDAWEPEGMAEALRACVFDVLSWPLVGRDLEAVLGNLRERVSPAAFRPPLPSAPLTSFGVFGASIGMRAVMAQVLRAAPTSFGVLICGEPGTGREMVARAIHANGPRAAGPFVKVDCQRDGQADLDLELFGSGTNGRRRPDEAPLETLGEAAKMRDASGGTLFLENAAAMGATTQRRLARWLGEGGSAGPRLDIRPMAAWTSSGDEADLSGLRGDLRERLTAIRIDLPPLRQRPDDIPLLATHFLKEACQQHGVAMKTLTRPALTLLAALPWRENARGLRTLVDRLAQMTPSGLVRLEDVLVHFRLDGDFGPATETLRDAKMRFEREYIGTVLRQHRGRMGETAASLGIQRTNLYRKVRQHKLGTSRPGRTDR